MAIAALARPWRGIPRQDFVVKTTRKEKRAPFCVLIDILGRHEQQRTPLLRSIEGSAIALQSIREVQTNTRTDSALGQLLETIWLSGRVQRVRAHATGSNLVSQTCFALDYKPFLPLTSPPVPFFCWSPRPFGRPRLVRLPFFGWPWRASWSLQVRDLESVFLDPSVKRKQCESGLPRLILSF